MKNLKCAEGQVARWIQYIESYNVKVTHRPGRLHGNADALSRRPCTVCKRNEQRSLDAKVDGIQLTGETVCAVPSMYPAAADPVVLDDPVIAADNDIAEQPSPSQEDTEVKSSSLVVTTCPKSALGEVTFGDTVTSDVRAVTRAQQQSSAADDLKQNQFMLEGWQPSDIYNAQLQDQHIGTIIVEVTAKQQPTWSQISGASSKTKTLWRQWDRLEIHGGLLYRKWITDNETDSHLQLIVPESKQAEVLHYFHDIPTAGHLGSDKTLERVRQSFYWPAMSTAIKQYCQQCDRCSARKPPKPTKGPLGECLVGEPMEKVAMDLLGPLPLTKQGNRYILTICDLFTKWTEAIAIPNAEAGTVASAFVNQFITRMGTPLILLTDLGKCFEAKLFQSVCETLQINKVATSVMRPQANGVVERFNRTLASMLTMYCESEQHNWDSYLQQVMMALPGIPTYHNWLHTYRLVFGREITLPMMAVIRQAGRRYPS